MFVKTDNPKRNDPKWVAFWHRNWRQRNKEYFYKKPEVKHRGRALAEVRKIERWLEQRKIWTSSKEIALHFNIGMKQVHRILDVIEYSGADIQFDYGERNLKFVRIKNVSRSIN